MIQLVDFIHKIMRIFEHFLISRFERKQKQGTAEVNVEKVDAKMVSNSDQPLHLKNWSTFPEFSHDSAESDSPTGCSFITTSTSAAAQIARDWKELEGQVLLFRL